MAPPLAPPAHTHLGSSRQPQPQSSLQGQTASEATTLLHPLPLPLPLPTHPAPSYPYPSGYYLPSSLLAPRVAVVLNVPERWHLVLFLGRLLSIVPAIVWGLPSVLLVLERAVSSALALYGGYEVLDGEGRRVGWGFGEAVAGLASIWCFAAGYLSFFFTDCLMSRWLINYTPQATIVRLLAISAANAWITSIFLSLTGGFVDSRLLLPGWIGIATTLTICYHITHQTINIRKETSTSINVFSIASFITMASLLALIYGQCPQNLHCAAFPEPPLVSQGRGVWLRLQDAARRSLDGQGDGKPEL